VSNNKNINLIIRIDNDITKEYKLYTNNLAITQSYNRLASNFIDSVQCMVDYSIKSEVLASTSIDIYILEDTSNVLEYKLLFAGKLSDRSLKWSNDMLSFTIVNRNKSLNAYAIDEFYNRIEITQLIQDYLASNSISNDWQYTKPTVSNHFCLIYNDDKVASEEIKDIIQYDSDRNLILTEHSLYLVRTDYTDSKEYFYIEKVYTSGDVFNRFVRSNTMLNVNSKAWIEIKGQAEEGGDGKSYFGYVPYLLEISIDTSIDETTITKLVFSDDQNPETGQNVIYTGKYVLLNSVVYDTTLGYFLVQLCDTTNAVLKLTDSIRFRYYSKTAKTDDNYVLTHKEISGTWESNNVDSSGSIVVFKDATYNRILTRDNIEQHFSDMDVGDLTSLHSPFAITIPAPTSFSSLDFIKFHGFTKIGNTHYARLVFGSWNDANHITYSIAGEFLYTYTYDGSTWTFTEKTYNSKSIFVEFLSYDYYSGYVIDGLYNKFIYGTETTQTQTGSRTGDKPFTTTGYPYQLYPFNISNKSDIYIVSKVNGLNIGSFRTEATFYYASDNIKNKTLFDIIKDSLIPLGMVVVYNHSTNKYVFLNHDDQLTSMDKGTINTNEIDLGKIITYYTNDDYVEAYQITTPSQNYQINDGDFLKITRDIEGSWKYIDDYLKASTRKTQYDLTLNGLKEYTLWDYITYNSVVNRIIEIKHLVKEMKTQIKIRGVL